MNPLFEQLIYKPKTRRQFTLLEILEQNEHVIGKTFVEKTQYTRRTILKDIKELKAYFDTSVLWIGDETGYHFSLKDPYAYEQKKQALLAEEPLFVFVDRVASGQCLSNAHWAQEMGVSSASFGRMKHQLQLVLNAHYKVKLTPETNMFIGDEANVRQLLYAFYFTLPVYPDSLAEKIKQMERGALRVQIGAWQIEKQQLNQWGNIAQLRRGQGHELPQRNDFTSLQAALVRAFDRQITSSLPDPEKVALFLLALDEKQFLDPLRQEQFLQSFPVTDDLSFFIRDNEGLAYRFLETYLTLMRLFFRLPNLYKEERAKIADQEESQIYEQFMSEFLLEKEHYQKALYVNYHLIGSAALKRWIQEEVEAELSNAGLEVIETPVFETTLLLRRLEVCNYPVTQLTNDTISLSQVPQKKEIKQALVQFLKQGKGN